MTNRRYAWLTVLCAAPVCAAGWHQGLYVDGGGYWRRRIPLTVINESTASLAGAPVELSVAKDGDLPDLIGHRVEDLRLCDERGNEYLFRVRAGDGRTLMRGGIPVGSRLMIPAVCEPQGRQLLYLYYDNPQAMAVPDVLEGRATVENGSFELGDGAPSSWSLDASDAAHKLSWVTERPHTGKRCMKTWVASGAEPSWIAARQRGLSIVGGGRYRLTGWVRAKGVVGQAGWYIHAGNDENPMLLGPVVDAGAGSYDWKRVELEFTAPKRATTLSLGTVLRGTGEAWFDDVVVERLDARPSIRAEVGRPEGMKLTRRMAPMRWLPGWQGRVTVTVRNFDRSGRAGLLAVADIRRLRRYLRTAWADAAFAVVTAGAKQAPALRAGESLLFAVDAPPRSESECWVYFSRQPKAAANLESQYERLVHSPANLARNADFELGGETPQDWMAGIENRPGVKLSARRVAEGRFGRFCARLDVPPETPAGWVGWRQVVPGQPSTSYWFAGYVKTKGVNDGEVRLHIHFLTAEGKLCASGAFASTQQSVSGDADWTLISGMVRSPSDCAKVELHLTMNAHGTLWHDGIVFCPAAHVDVGAAETPSAEKPGLHVWAENPIVKVFREDSPRPLPEIIELFAARNEQEPAQLCLRSNRTLKGVEVRATSLRGPGGAVLDAPRIEHVGYVPVDQPSSYFSTDVPAYRRRVPNWKGRTDGWAGWWPDPLLPGGRFDLRADETTPVWLTWTIPASIAAGVYRGTVEVVVPGQRPMSVPVRLTVWDFALPEVSSLKVIYDLRSGPGWNFLGDESRRRAWWRLMAAHRISPGLLRPEPVIRYRDGKPVLDTRAFDEAAAYCLDELKINVFYTPWQFYGFGWGHPPRRFAGFEPFTPEYRRALQACIRAYYDHLKQRGWADKAVYYISDEPHYRDEGIIPQMQKLCDLVHEAAPEAQIYSSTWRHVPEWDEHLDIWGVGAYGCFPVDEMKRLQAAGRHIWFTTDGQLALDTPYNAIERLYPYYCYKYGAEGYEFWGVSWWTYDPFEFGWHSFIHQSPKPGEWKWVRYPHGDGYLTYPGWRIGREGPISTIRLEQVREGIEDYEYLVRLRDLMAKARPRGVDVNRAQEALRAAESLVDIPNRGGYRSTDILPDPDRVPVIRRQVAEAILRLQDRRR